MVQKWWFNKPDMVLLKNGAGQTWKIPIQEEYYQMQPIEVYMFRFDRPNMKSEEQIWMKQYRRPPQLIHYQSMLIHSVFQSSKSTHWLGRLRVNLQTQS